MDILKRKIKTIDNIELNIIIKKLLVSKISKRKIMDSVKVINELNKKQKCYSCIMHEEKYICDIYECNGKINRDKFKN